MNRMYFITRIVSPVTICAVLLCAAATVGCQSGTDQAGRTAGGGASPQAADTAVAKKVSETQSIPPAAREQITRSMKAQQESGAGSIKDAK